MSRETSFMSIVNQAYQLNTLNLARADLNFQEEETGKNITNLNFVLRYVLDNFHSDLGVTQRIVICATKRQCQKLAKAKRWEAD